MSRSKRILIALGLMLGVALVATEAQATTSVCRGEAPAVGAQIRGPVLYVIDGGRLCVALEPSPSTWVELQVLDPRVVRTSSADDAKQRLMAAAFARDAVCVITGTSAGRATAACMIEGEQLSARVSQPEIAKAAQIWR